MKTTWTIAIITMIMFVLFPPLANAAAQGMGPLGLESRGRMSPDEYAGHEASAPNPATANQVTSESASVTETSSFAEYSGQKATVQSSTNMRQTYLPSYPAWTNSTSSQVPQQVQPANLCEGLGTCQRWVFGSLTCSGGGSVSGQTATLTLTAGSTVTCTYTDSKAGTIVINKSGFNGNGVFNFTATGSGLPASFSIATTSQMHFGTQVFTNLVPGSYSVTESGPSSPWVFTSLTCTGGGSVSGQTATIALTAGQTVTCTYTDTKMTGTIFINKSSVGGDAQFNFTATGGLTSPFSITTVGGIGVTMFSNLVPGSYSVTESGPSSPWLFTNLTCNSGGSVSGQTATITLTATQSVTCTYTDTKGATTGTIVIQKSAVGGNAQFNFTATGTGLPASFSITTAFGDSNSSTFSGLSPGSYSVTETGPSTPHKMIVQNGRLASSWCHAKC